MNKQDILEMRHASTPDMTYRIFFENTGNLLVCTKVKPSPSAH